MIQTPNLQLLPIERVHVEALLRSKSELAALLQVTVPDGWPHFPDSLSAYESHASNPLEADWRGYFFLHPKDRVLVGSGAFKGPPDDSGTVEIGYEIASEYWNRGWATEAVQGMIDYAFSHEEVRAVIAHTLAQRNASNRVLQKVGMKFIAEVDDPEEGKVWRWQISRDEYHHDCFNNVFRLAEPANRDARHQFSFGTWPAWEHACVSNQGGGYCVDRHAVRSQSAVSGSARG